MNAIRQPRAAALPGGRERRVPGARLKRVALTCAMVIATLNIWTGSPLLALWVGSRVQGSGPPSMLAVGVVAVALGVLTIALVKLLARIDGVYARVAGRPLSVSRHVPWLRSMRGERPHEKKHARELSPLEVIVITTVVLVVVLFEIWFFFYSPSPIDQRSGRSHKAPLIGVVARHQKSQLVSSRAWPDVPQVPLLLFGGRIPPYT